MAHSNFHRLETVWSNRMGMAMGVVSILDCFDSVVSEGAVYCEANHKEIGHYKEIFMEKRRW